MNLDGFWEEKYTIGTRIEIDGKNISILWRNYPVLQTKFKEKKENNRIYLILNDKAMRNKGATNPYATVKELYFENDKLTFVELFEIAGEKSQILEKTENSRYGN